MEERSNKLARLSRDASVRLAIPNASSSSHLLKLEFILLYKIPLTSQEAFASISKEYIAYVQNLPKADKMELYFEATFYAYQTNSLLSLVVAH